MTDTMRNRVLGYILGSVSRGQFPSAEPVAYLYNGVRLPKLPDWDKEAYPYAVIIYREVSQLYELLCLSADVYYSETSFVASNGIYSQCKDEAWSEFGTLEGESYAYIQLSSSIYTLVWANFTIENDGITYLTASDPVPVYE